MHSNARWLWVLMVSLGLGLVGTSGWQTASAQSTPASQGSRALKTVLDELSRTYGINLLYEPRVVNGKTTNYKPSSAVSLEKALNDLLTPLALKPVKVDNQNYAVIAGPKPAAAETVVVAAPEVETKTQAQPSAQAANSFRQISGTVIDDMSKEPMAGASVTVPGTKLGVATDKNGQFTLQIPESTRQIAIAFVGYQQVLQPVRSNSSKYDVSLRSVSTSTTEDVVVMGIINRRKESFTGATASFTQEQIKQVGNQNIIEGIRALDPSFLITENNLAGANPNTLPEIEIRGKTSVDNRALRDEFAADPNQPLFILDGFETNLRTIMDLDMNRVESVTLLKDAASTAIYGARAANGVVVIETRKPTPGALRLFYNSDLTIQAPDLSVYNLMNAEEKLEFERLSGRYNSIYALTSPEQQLKLDDLYSSRLTRVKRGVDTYWLSEPVQTGFSTGHSLRTEGGDNRVRYGAGVQYKKQEGVMKGSGRETWGGSMDLIYRTGKLNVMNKLFVNGYTADESPYGSFSNFANANPYYEKYDEEGFVNKYLEESLARTSGTERIVNPMYNASLNNINQTKNFAFQNNLQISYKINNYLNVQGGVQVNKGTNTNVIFYPSEHSQFDNLTVFEKGKYTQRQYETSGYQTNLMATFGKVFGRIHNVNNSIRAEWQENRNESYLTTVIGFPANSNGNPAFGYSYQQDSKPTAASSIYRRTNFLFSGSYTLDRRFVVDYSLRMDGSTAFGSNNKYQSFWSVGAAWNLHNEPMFKDANWINSLRLKANMGITGNQNFGQITSVSVYDYMNNLNVFGQGTTLGTLGNPDLEWQRTEQTNIGVDFGLYKNRLSGYVNVFRKYTNPLIIMLDLPASTGLTGYPSNVGDLTNNGVEANLRFAIINNMANRKMWTLGLTAISQKAEYSGLTNKLENLNKQQLENNALVRYMDGRSPDDLWAVQSLGIDPATGMEVFRKIDGQSTFLYNTDDIQVVGNTRPWLEGVFSNNVSIKGFSLSFYLRYRFGSDVFNDALYSRVENISDANVMNNQDKRALTERWKQAGDISQFKSISITAYTPMSSRFVQEENTIAGESISVGYDFVGQQWLKTIGMKTLTVRAYTNDVFRISTVKRERGIDYPFARSFSLSINASF